MKTKLIKIKLKDPKFCHGCPIAFSGHPWSRYTLLYQDFRVAENTCQLGFLTHLIVESPKDQTKVNMILRDPKCIKAKWKLQLI